MTKTTNDQIEDKPLFEAAGYKVYFTHLQEPLPPQYKVVMGTTDYRKQIIPAAKGSTICNIVGENMTYGEVSRCGLKDQFNKATGRKMALRKVLNMHFNRPQRAIFWFEYFLATGNHYRALEIAVRWHIGSKGSVEVLVPF